MQKALMAQWHCAALEMRFPHGFLGSIPSQGVSGIEVLAD